MRSLEKWGLLGALYLSQGLPFGFFTQALPAMLREMDVPLPAIGLAHLLALPWALKFLWAPLVDAWASRRTWILAMQGGAALLMIAISLLDPARMLPVVLLCVLLSNFAAATQDIATDGLAVNLLDAQERGVGNGVQVAGYRLGMIAGGGLMLVLLSSIGWSVAFLGMAVILALASLPVVLLKEGRREAAPQPQQAVSGALAWLSAPGAWAWLGALGLYKGSGYLAEGMLRPWLVDAGLGLGDIGFLVGIGGFSAGLLGAVVGGITTRWLDRRLAVGIWGLAGALGLLGYAAAAVAGPQLPELRTAAVVLEPFFGGMATVALFTAMMDRCRLEHAGSDYTLQASVVVLASGSAAALSGVIAQEIGYAALFGLSAALTTLGAGACFLAFRDNPR